MLNWLSKRMWRRPAFAAATAAMAMVSGAATVVIAAPALASPPASAPAPAPAAAGWRIGVDDAMGLGLAVGAVDPVMLSPRPLRLSLLQNAESIYAPPALPREDEGVNAGGVHLDLTVNYLTDYVYRGIDRSDQGGSEDAPNLQFDGKIEFDLGRLPHPFVGLFVNVYNDDPISRFQEIRPYFGLEWTLRPLTISAGNISYIFPEREDVNTSEAYVRLDLDDARFLNADRPLLSPYVFAAYDYVQHDGLYLEGGVRHDFPIEDLGVVLTATADVAYVLDHGLFSAAPGGEDTGFQHYDIGLIGVYSLNALLNVPRRYGQWELKGYLYYTDGIENDLTSTSQLWGGVGIHFKY